MDSWLNCSSCGHRFGAHMSACPKCSQPNDAKATIEYAYNQRNIHNDVVAWRDRWLKVGAIAGGVAIIGVIAYMILT